MHRIFFLLLIFFPLSMHATIDDDRDKIQQRIQPIGSVRVEKNKEPISGTVSTTAEIKQPDVPTPSGQAIYEKHCIVCHRDGIAGAPKFRDEASWRPRLTKSDINALVNIANKGINAMPAKGTCQECSDSDIKAAINYMVPQK